MTEAELMRGDGVLVTTARLVIGGTTYAVRNLTSAALKVVEQRIEIQKPGDRTGLGAVGCLATAFAIVVAGVAISVDELIYGSIALLVGLVVGTLISSGASPGIYEDDITYHVMLTDASGSRSAYSTKDKSEAEDVLNAISQAIAVGT